jgi:Flp pilus assembly pilin Flp
MIKTPFTDFLCDEHGAITVDWVVVTAGVVGLAIAVIAVVSGGVENGSNDISQSLANAQPEEDPFPTNTDFSASTDVVTD